MLKPNSAGIGQTFRPDFGRIFGRKGQSDLPNSGEFCQFRLDFSGSNPNSAGHSGLFCRKSGQNSAAINPNRIRPETLIRVVSSV